MAISKPPAGSLPSAPTDPRPRAQVAYEGEDEFSMMSLDPQRRAGGATAQKLAPAAPGEKQEVKVDELKRVNDQGVVSFLRRIFAK